MLNLTMKHLDSSDENHESFSNTNVDWTDILLVMKQKEDAIYKCCDYMLRREVKYRNDLEEEDIIDDVCRQRMCDWSYRVVDHFNGSRDLVFCSFNLLNRFLDRCGCDRTALKLAVMTTLYLSIKLNCHKPVSIDTFAELSRNEFEVEHIEEMEGIILQVLNWQVNPPTAASFINILHLQLPKHIKSSVKQTILQRARFFSELSLFDYFFVTQKASTIAMSSIMNALEGIDSQSLSPIDREIFLTSLAESVNCNTDLIQACRQRLWNLYRQSSQFQQHDLEKLMARESCDSSETKTFSIASHGGSTTSSPVCVSSFDYKNYQ